MPLRLAASLLASLLLVLSVGCSARIQHPGLAAGPRRAGSIHFIGLDEIASISARNVEDLLQRARPELLRPRAVRGRGLLAYATPIVYLNDVRQGELEVLHHMPVEQIVEIVYLSPLEADQALVGLHGAGAIVIRTRRGLGR